MTPEGSPESRQTTRDILESLAAGDADESIRLAEVIGNFGERGFGIVLLLASLLAAIPIPGLAGGLSSPLVMLVGMQMMVGSQYPWLPRFLLNRPIKRSIFVRARDSLSPKFARMERWIRPRRNVLFERRIFEIISGLLLLVLGFLLFLPIPMTNYLFALVVFLFAITFIEKDGGLLLVSWLTVIVLTIVITLTTGTIAAAISELLIWFRTP